jgi:hypothetical protein
MKTIMESLRLYCEFMNIKLTAEIKAEKMAFENKWNVKFED